MKEFSIQVYLLDSENYITYLSIIRDYTKESISEIKRKIEQQNPILICYFTEIDSSKLKEFYILIESLLKLGAKLELFRESPNFKEKIDPSIIKNLIHRREEIEFETQNDINNEVSND